MSTDSALLEKLKSKEWRMNHLYKIKTKDKRLVTFKLNKAQAHYIKNRGHKNIILKARQLGFSTVGLIDLLDDTIMSPNTNSAIIAHEREKVGKLFEIVKRAYNNLPDELRPRASYDNRNELYFPDLDSKIYVTLDARSETVHNLHVSELAFIPHADERMAGILESVPRDGKITFESTANGMAGYFFEEWDQNPEYQKFFYPWTWGEEYAIGTPFTEEELDAQYHELSVSYELIPEIRARHNLTKQQLAWYISKARTQKHLIKQEYPTTEIEAFIASGRNVFSMYDLNKHTPNPPSDRLWGDLLVWEAPLKDFTYVIGCDTAEGLGGDNSVIEVFNAGTGEQVAEFASGHVPPDTLAGYLVEIGQHYNNAFIVIEMNNHGRSTLDNLKTKYYNIYRREIRDKAGMVIEQRLGWQTSLVTKPILVNALEQAVREQSIKINSAETLKEMRVFVQTDESGRSGFGAEGSAKDDRVIACGLAVQGMRHLPATKAPKTIAQQRLEEYIRRKTLPEDSIEYKRKRGFIRGVRQV